MPPSASKFYSARIVERRDISSDLWAIRVDPGGEFKFRSGQYATLGVVYARKNITSGPTPSSPRLTKNYLEFFFELVPHGK